jgi:hypothetical protein
VDVVLVLSGIPLGIISSLVAWWILWRALGPRGEFAPALSEAPDVARNGAVRYRVKFLSTGRRAMMDVVFSAALFLPNIETDGGQALIEVPLHLATTPRIGGRRRGRRAGRTVLSSRHRVLTLRLRDTSAGQLERLPADLRRSLVECAPGSLRAVLTKYPGATLVLACTASDSWTGARRAFVSAPYTKESIRNAVFRRGPTFEMV